MIYLTEDLNLIKWNEKTNELFFFKYNNNEKKYEWKLLKSNAFTPKKKNINIRNIYGVHFDRYNNDIQTVCFHYYNNDIGFYIDRNCDPIFFVSLNKLESSDTLNNAKVLPNNFEDINDLNDFMNNKEIQFRNQPIKTLEFAAERTNPLNPLFREHTNPIHFPTKITNASDFIFNKETVLLKKVDAKINELINSLDHWTVFWGSYKADEIQEKYDHFLLLVEHGANIKKAYETSGLNEILKYQPFNFYYNTLETGSMIEDIIEDSKSFKK